MLNKLTYKQKFNYLLIATGILIFFVFIIAIKPTIDLRRSYKSLVKDIKTAQDAPAKIRNLENQLESFRFLFSDRSESAGNHEKIHEFTGKYCQNNRIIFAGYPPVHIFKEQNYTIETNIVELEAGFTKLLKLLYEIENKMDYGKVVSVRFYSKTELRTKIKKLFLTIYIQHITKNYDEKK